MADAALQAADATGPGRFAGRAFVLPLRVYYEDTDAAGIVYYANYLKFAERARTELLRALGTDHATLAARAGIAFAVRHCHAEYLRPARLDDALEVHTTVTRVGGASLAVRQRVVAADGTRLVDLDVRLACLDRDQRPARLPAAVRTGLRALAARGEAASA